MAIDLNKLREKYNAIKSANAKSSGNLNFWKPKVGTSVIRILPPWNPQKGMYFRDTAMHYSLGEDEKSFVCPRAEGSACPICELRQQLWSSNDSELQELARNLSAKPKVFMNIIDRANPEMGVQVASLTGKYAVEGIHEAILGYCLDPQWGDLTDPQYGRDITIVKTGSQLDVKYEVRPSPAPTPIFADPQMQQAILAQIKDLDKIVKLANMEDMENAIADIQELADKAMPNAPKSAVPTSTPHLAPTPASVSAPTAGKSFWIVNEKGEVEEVLEAVVKKLVDAGMNPQVMAVGENDWKTAADYGIKATPKPAPKPAPKPPVAPKPAAPAPAKPAPAKPAPVAPTAPVAPAPAKPAPAKPAAEPAKAGKMAIPEQYSACFGTKYDASKDDCQLCAYEAFCVQTMKAVA